jgi:hypothetical protein
MTFVGEYRDLEGNYHDLDFVALSKKAKVSEKGLHLTLEIIKGVIWQ